MKNTNTFWPTKNIDLVIAYSIMDTFANLNKGVLPINDTSHWDGSEQHNYTLPSWMLALIEALKKIHGEAYYAFALDNVTNELVSQWLKQGISEEIAANFKAAVRSAMQTHPKALLH